MLWKIDIYSNIKAYIGYYKCFGGQKILKRKNIRNSPY